MDEVKKEYGELDAVVKDGVFLAPPKNKKMMNALWKKVDSRMRVCVFNKS